MLTAGPEVSSRLQRAARLRQAACPVLEIRDLRVSFITDHGGVPPAVSVPAVDGVCLRIPAGKTVALVGESGCGKTVTALSILRLIPQPPGKLVGGRILFNGGQGSCSVDLLQLPERELRMVRGNRIAMIFQEPFAALNPVYTVGDQIAEAIELHRRLRHRLAAGDTSAWSAAVEMLGRVGIGDPEQRARDYPHQLSGGMRQRVMIAMALACDPLLLIADEPTTALDATVQLQILELLRSFQAASGMSILIITHDLGVAAEIADDVYVMYAGRIVEHGAINDVLDHPLHPYTQGLLACIPRLQRAVPLPRATPLPHAERLSERKAGSRRQALLDAIPGAVPEPGRLPSGCRFHPRCRLSAALAAGDAPASVALLSEQWHPAEALHGTEACQPYEACLPPVTFVGAVLRRCVGLEPMAGLQPTAGPAEGSLPPDATIESGLQAPARGPDLRELRPGHFVACWEANSSPPVVMEQKNA